MKYLNLLLFALASVATLGTVKAQADLITSDFEFSPHEAIRFQNKVYFREGSRIWQTDGTLDNTKVALEASINLSLFVINDVLYIFELNGNQITLKTTNSTLDSATVLLQNAGSYVKHFQLPNNRLLIWVRQGTADAIVSTDGTAAGTFLIGIPQYAFGNASNTAAVIGDNLYFYAHFRGIYKTDGTPNSLQLFRDYYGQELYSADFSRGTFLNDKFYFKGCHRSLGCKFWSLHSLTEAIQLEFELNTPLTHSHEYIDVQGDKFLFTVEKLGIYTVDTSLNPSTLDTLLSFPFTFFETKNVIKERYYIGDKLLYWIVTERFGSELWSYDKSTGTITPLDIWKYSFSAFPKDAEPKFFSFQDGYLHFLANDGIHGFELWRTDGTLAGTTLVRDLLPGALDFEVNFIERAADKIVISTVSRNSPYDFSLWSIDLQELVPIAPPQRAGSETWFQTVSTQTDVDVTSAFSTDIKTDAEGNIIWLGYYVAPDEAEFSLSGYRVQNNFELPRGAKYATPFLSKMNKYGEVIWAMNVGSIYNNWSSLENRMTVDNDGNIIVAGFFENPVGFGGQAILEGRGLFLMKINKEGNLKWHKQVMSENYGFLIDEIGIDADDNIYMSLNCTRSYFSVWEGERVEDTKAPTPYFVKFDKDGNRQWLRMIGDRTDIRTNSLSVSKAGKVISVISQGKYPASENCKEGAWKNEIRAIDPQSGNNIWSVTLASDYYCQVRSTTIMPNGDIIAVGFIKGTLTIGEKTISSPALGDCYEYVGFVAHFNTLGRLQKLFIDEEVALFNEVVAKDAETYAVMGRRSYESRRVYDSPYLPPSTGDVFYRAYNLQGIKVAERAWLQTGRNNYELSPKIAFDKDNYLIVANATSTPMVDTFPQSNRNYLEFQDGFSYLMRLALDEFKQFKPQSLPDVVVNAFPNPATNYVTLYSELEAWSEYKLDIFAANGQFLQHFSKNDDSPQNTINLLDFPSGLLIFRLNNGTTQMSIKVLKQ